MRSAVPQLSPACVVHIRLGVRSAPRCTSIMIGYSWRCRRRDASGAISRKNGSIMSRHTSVLLAATIAVVVGAVTAASASTTSTRQAVDMNVLDKEMARLRWHAEDGAEARHGATVRRYLAEAGQSPAPQQRIGRPWDPERPADGDNETVVVLAHYKEDLDWLHKRQPFDYFVVTKCCHQLGWTPHTLPINRGTEASSYFKFISENYHRLPRYMIFLHAHESSHHSQVRAWHYPVDLSWP